MKMASPDRPSMVKRPTSEDYVPDNSPKHPLLLKTPSLPRTMLMRSSPSRRDSLGAPTTPLVRRENEREVIVQRCTGFFPDLPGSPLQLGITPHQANHYKTSNLSSAHNSMISWSSPAPHVPGSKTRTRYAASMAPNRHGRQMKARPSGVAHDDHIIIKPVHPTLRSLPAPTPLHITSPLCQARDLKHKRELEQQHNLEATGESNAGRVDDEETELGEKNILLKLKQFIGDEVVTASWDLESPLKSWRRVRTNKVGTIVEGLSLVSARMSGDIMEISILLEKLSNLQVLLIHNNPMITGDIRYLSLVKHLRELRIPGESMSGNITGLTSLIDLKKFRIYNRNKIEGLEKDLQKMLPHCDIDIEAISK